MLDNTDHRTWSDLGWGGEVTHVCIEANGRSGGVLLAWKASYFDQEMTWRGRHIVAARLGVSGRRPPPRHRIGLRARHPHESGRTVGGSAFIM